MSQVDFTLQFEPVNSGMNNYWLQVSTDFDTGNYEWNDQQIIAYPQIEGDKLLVKLFVKSGNNCHIVHDFSIGEFPNNISTWCVEVEYYNENNVVIKKEIKTEQAEGEAEPRPVKEDALG